VDTAAFVYLMCRSPGGDDPTAGLNSALDQQLDAHQRAGRLDDAGYEERLKKALS
jgi:hypothetical protein